MLFKKKWKTVGALIFLLVLTLAIPMAASSEENGLIVTDMAEVNAEQLVESLLGGSVEVVDINLINVEESAGYFTGGDGIIGFDQGVILSTGSVHNVVGPNTSNSISYTTGLDGDPDLDELIPGNTLDATVLEFEFIPQTDYITFEYVFASDEYNQYVNSNFNDVFGFYINGENEALIPGTDIPVSINNVNGGNPYGTDASNPEYFRNNSRSDPGPATINTEMDGLTVVLTVEAEVAAGEVNTIKMAIADVVDRQYDSNVFIRAGSFTDQKAPPTFPFGECLSGDCTVADEDLTIEPVCTEEKGVYGWVINNPNDEDIEVKWGLNSEDAIGMTVAEPGETMITTSTDLGDTIHLEFPFSEIVAKPVSKEKNAENEKAVLLADSEYGEEDNGENGDSEENGEEDNEEIVDSVGNGEEDNGENGDSEENGKEENEEIVDSVGNGEEDNGENGDSEENGEEDNGENGDSEENGEVENEENGDSGENTYSFKFASATHDLECYEKIEEVVVVEKQQNGKKEEKGEREPETVVGGKLPVTSSPWYNVLVLSTLTFFVSGIVMVHRMRKRLQIN
ncbi:choice-of-anchor L domain-containing protein [Salipaludibacillus sp. HK11]|uniref:choice-of-anchor L domain-containing protein n=1 Tax=Salipaludibacillus sp. HK11 TaxID=3394320 RepID=UPI0039FDA357